MAAGSCFAPGAYEKLLESENFRAMMENSRFSTLKTYVGDNSSEGQENQHAGDKRKAETPAQTELDLTELELGVEVRGLLISQLEEGTEHIPGKILVSLPASFDVLLKGGQTNVAACDFFEIQKNPRAFTEREQGRFIGKVAYCWQFGAVQCVTVVVWSEDNTGAMNPTSEIIAVPLANICAPLHVYWSTAYNFMKNKYFSR
jgi:hypothetical protein